MSVTVSTSPVGAYTGKYGQRAASSERQEQQETAAAEVAVSQSLFYIPCRDTSFLEVNKLAEDDGREWDCVKPSLTTRRPCVLRPASCTLHPAPRTTPRRSERADSSAIVR